MPFLNCLKPNMVVKGCCLLVAAIPMAGFANPSSRSPNERAQREAENPLRIIIEASKLPRKSAIEKPAVVAPLPASARKPEMAPASRFDGAKGGIPSAAARPAVPPDAPGASQINSPGDARTDVQGVGGAEPPPAERPIDPGGAAATVQQAESPLVRKEPLARTEIRLLHMVEPEVPEHLWQRLGKGAEVKLRLQIEADGQVSDVQLDSPIAEGVDPLVKSAVMRWRFSELPRPTQAAITLVFRREDP